MNEPNEIDDLTPDQAADMLNVSASFLAKLLVDGLIPTHTTGEGCRLLRQDVLAYKQETYTKRRAALAELTALSQELGLFDDPIAGARRS